MRSEVAETIGSAMIELAAPNAPPTNLPPRPPEERAVEQTSASCKGSAPSNTEQEIRGKWEARSTAFGDRMTLIIYDTIDDSLRPGTTGYIPPELFKHFLPQYGRVIEKVLTAAPASFDILDLVETAAGGRKGDGARAIIARRMGNKYVYADPMPLIPGYADFHSICKLLFVACELPAMTAWDHGLYDRDDHIVLSEQHLHNSIRNMMARPMAPEEVPALLDIPAGVRLLRDGDDLIVSTLVCSFTRGIGEHSLRIRKDTSVEDLGVRRIVPVPGMVLY